MLALPQVGKVVIITWLRGCLRLQNGHMVMAADNILEGGTEAACLCCSGAPVVSGNISEIHHLNFSSSSY